MYVSLKSGDSDARSRRLEHMERSLWCRIKQIDIRISRVVS